jgi:flagellin-like protein
MYKKTSNFKTKFNRSVKAISPVIATLLMIAIAVVASLVAYAWVMGYMGGATTKAGKSLDLPSFASDPTTGNLIIYVQNVGQGTIQLKQDGAVYVNDTLKNIRQSTSPTGSLQLLGAGQLITVAMGQTVELEIDYPYNPLDKVKIRIVTIEGTYMETTGKGTSNPTNNNPPASTYTLTVAWNGQGSINPGGPLLTINQGSTQTLTITPNSGYRVQAVTVDGVSEGAILSRTFTNINSNHIVFATFEPNPANTYTITATAGPNGAINPTGQITGIPSGASRTFNIIPNGGYHVSSIIVDDISQPVDTAYTFPSVTSNHRIAVIFEADTPVNPTTHTITAAATTGGTITPSGATPVNNLADQQFQIAAITGYHLADVLIDGASIGTPATYTFTAVTSDHTINAIFTSDTINPPGGPYTITATAGPNGAIDPNGVISVTSGNNQAFTITPNAGYQIANVQVDSGSVGALASYTFTNVIGPHAISATFEPIAANPVTLTITFAGTGTGKINDGTIDHAVTYTKQYNSGTTVTLTPTADAGSTFNGWTGNGTSGNTAVTWTLTGNTAVTATFNTIASSQYSLTVNTNPANLSPQPNRNPPGTSSGTNTWLYNTGTSVTVTRGFNINNYDFMFWILDGMAQDGNSITVIMNAQHTATAYYSQEQGRSDSDLDWNSTFPAEYNYVNTAMPIGGRLTAQGGAGLNNIDIHIALTKPDGTTETLPVIKTNSTGHFATFYMPTAAGQYTISAYWIGDGSYRAAASPVETFIVYAADKKMHISSINMPPVLVSDTEKHMHVYVTVVDSAGIKIGDVAVTGTWSVSSGNNIPSPAQHTHNTADAGQSDWGVAEFRNPDSNANPDHFHDSNTKTYTFTVNNLVLAGWTYNSSANVETNKSVTG